MATSRPPVPAVVEATLARARPSKMHRVDHIYREMLALTWHPSRTDDLAALWGMPATTVHLDADEAGRRVRWLLGAERSAAEAVDALEQYKADIHEIEDPAKRAAERGKLVERLLKAAGLEPPTRMQLQAVPTSSVAWLTEGSDNDHGERNE